MRISKFSIRRPVFTFVTMMLVIILGVVSFMNIPLKLIPEINPPIGVVVTNYSGAGPNEVVERVSKPLEESLSTLEGIDQITSTSQEGASLVLMQFSWTTKLDDVQSEILERLNDTPLPDDAGNPRFLKFDPSQFPIIQLSLSSSIDAATLQELSEDLEQELTRIRGVASVNLSGLTTEEVRVQLDQERLEEFQLSQSEVVDAIGANSVSLPGDTIVSDGKQLTTRVLSTIDSVETLQNLVITRNPANGNNVTLGDIGSIAVQPEETQTITRANQESAILLSVLQQSDANTADVSRDFQDSLNELLEQDKYEDIESNIIFDQGDYIQRAIGNMMNTLLLGGLFAMVVLFLFLRSFKSPLIIGIAIPYSVIVTFVLMYFSNFTLNIMTLGGLALGIGMLVDNAIVVIENIYRHLSMGKDPKKAAYDGAREVGPAITASTLTTVAVFLPVIFITGLIGELFTEFALTIAFSLFASLFVALTVVPMLASKLLLKPRKDMEAERQESRFMKSVDSGIRWALGRRALVLLLTVIVFAGSLYGLSRVGAVFLPNTDEGFFTLNVELESGSSLEETRKVVEALEGDLSEENDVDLYVSLIGSTQQETFRGTGSTNEAEIYIKLNDAENRTVSTFDFVDNVKRNMERTAASVNNTAELSFNLQSTAGSAPNTLSFNVRDSEEDRLAESVEKIEEALSGMSDITEVTSDLDDTVDEIQITVNRENALEQGLAPAQIAMVVNNVTRGSTAIQMTNAENNEVYPVNVSYDDSVTESIEALEGLLIKKPDGTFTNLGAVTDIEIGGSPSSVQRIDKQSAVQFTAKYRNSTNLGDISREVDKEIEDLDLPEETEIVFGGDRELLESSLDDMVLAFVLAIVFIYIVMAAQFESFKYPFVIMFTVPLMIVGVALALMFTNTPLSLPVVIGIIVLAGIVVNNAIVLVDYVNQRKEQGYKTYDALVEAVKVRMRPIFMTALTTILGLLPLSLGLGEGTEVNQPMGIAVIGGLITSTLLTLLVIPIVYSFFDKDTRRMNKKYVTPDGQLIPAYLMDDRRVDSTKEEPEVKAEVPANPTQSNEKEDMVRLLENIMRIVKDTDDDSTKK
ncbi:MMPL family transporter [Bacillus lacus]|uniref:MMPL family transporter n=1 Tax=Metabacillus lacus TaxID=1983721 RepID=A0A7X2M181_9BACI|nr:efflux RND transporter permease subunit [Metabacillus lacus]MRX74377.1 MMPL family transporter [Metabacillus lacus]